MAKAQAQQPKRKSGCKEKSSKSGCLRRCAYLCYFQQHHYQFNQQEGQIISWSSAGKMGFKGSKKNTPYAAQMAAADAAKIAFDAGLKRVDVYVKGPGCGQRKCDPFLSQNGIEVVMIKDVTPLPHNGCRPPKKRRV